MALGRLRRFLQFYRSNRKRRLRYSIDEGTSFIPIPSKQSSRRHSKFPSSSGSLSSSEHPRKKSALKHFNLQMARGKLRIFLQPRKFKKRRLGRCSIDEGSSLVAVSAKSSIDGCSIFTEISGNFWIFLHQLSSKVWRDFEWILFGRVLRFSQPLKFKQTSFLRAPRDGWTTSKFLNCWRFSTSRFGVAAKSGVKPGVVLISGEKVLQFVHHLHIHVRTTKKEKGSLISDRIMTN